MASRAGRRESSPRGTWAGFALLLLYSGLLALPSDRRTADARALELAEEACRAGAERALASLAWDPGWRRHPRTGPEDLASEGPYRTAFAVQAEPRPGSEGTFEILALGSTADRLRPAQAGREVRGAGGGPTRSFDPGYLVAAATLRGTVVLERDAAGFPVVRWSEPPRMAGAADPEGSARLLRDLRTGPR